MWRMASCIRPHCWRPWGCHRVQSRGVRMKAGLLQNPGPNTVIDLSTQLASRHGDSSKGDANLALRWAPLSWRRAPHRPPGMFSLSCQQKDVFHYGVTLHSQHAWRWLPLGCWDHELPSICLWLQKPRCHQGSPHPSLIALLPHLEAVQWEQIRWQSTGALGKSILEAASYWYI